MGERASEAGAMGNQGTLYQVLKELQARGADSRKDGGKQVVAEVEKERESWKLHFEQVSKTRGEVKERVWENVKKLDGVGAWMGLEPSDMEMDKCVSRMNTKRKPGKDKFSAEALKFGGKKLRSKIYAVVRKMWKKASTAEDGKEADEWPSGWRIGLVVPLWKNKGKRTDKNTWRGITLLSVGSKLMARVVALRLQRWSETFLNEEQNGFRRGRSVDDCLMVSRRVAEEVNRMSTDDWVLMSFFDIEKAYPRVCKDALWKLLKVRGCDDRMIKVCKGLHEGTAYAVKLLGGVSSEWTPDRGLREGCPSSPPLFNIYHDAVMEDFRVRRASVATNAGRAPGLKWHYKVDGRLRKKARGRKVGEGRWGQAADGSYKGFASEVHELILGDMQFADDTGILGEEAEVRVAEGIFIQTLLDWEEKAHPGKTERLRLSGRGRQPYDVRQVGEVEVARHVGGWISERGDNHKDTSKKINRGFEVARKTAKAWGVGSKHGRGGNSGLNITSRLQTMKGLLMPTLTGFARSRSWTEGELKQLQRVAKYAVRRCMGMDVWLMRDVHVSDDMMYDMSGWEQVGDIIRRQTLHWLGHVARMPTTRRPKQMLCGWWDTKAIVSHSKSLIYPSWINKVLGNAGISDIDWFRQAMNRKGWRKTIQTAYPTKRLTKEERITLNRWSPMRHGQVEAQYREPIQETPEVVQANEEELSDDEDEYECPVCNEKFKHGNQLQFHYDAEHSVRDPEVVTVISRQCLFCKEFFARKQQVWQHVCPAKARLRERIKMDIGEWHTTIHGPPLPPPEGWWVATDGSGQSRGEGDRYAGWGAVVFRMPLVGDLPDYVLHGPVVTQEWDHLWMGARESTNNTGELMAIGEAMIWLRDEAPDNGTTPVTLRFDSYYAANMAQGIWDPKSNEELVAQVRKLTMDVEAKRVILWEHVYGHTGALDNELADRAADSGAKGKVGQASSRWTAPPPVTPLMDPNDTEYCRKCGELVPKREHVWHTRRCTVAGFVIPADKDKCRKCGLLVPKGVTYVVAGAPASYGKARKEHEEICIGVAPLVAAAQVAHPKAKPAAKPRAKAKVKAKAKAKVKAKAKS